MEFKLQDTVLGIILLSFEEESENKVKALKAYNLEYDLLIASADKDTLEKGIAFIDFIDSLYPEEDADIKSTLHVLRVEASKELDFRVEKVTQGVIKK